MKVSVSKKLTTPTTVTIHTEFIKLQDFLKFCDAVSSGGVAKMLVQNGEVTVDGAVCTMRGKKLYPGCTVGYAEKTWLVAGHEA